jgi:NAD+-dependent protein deacetylase SIR2
VQPDVVLFYESLPHNTEQDLLDHLRQADLMCVIGTSLKVEPIASIPKRAPRTLPKVLINKTPMPTKRFRWQLLGDCELITALLAYRLASINPSRWATLPAVVGAPSPCPAARLQLLRAGVVQITPE